MRKVIYQLSVSADGYVAGPNDDISWTAPSVELHRYFNETTRRVDTFLYGRKLYELMEPYWPTADQDPAAPEEIAEFARLYRATPRIVFSRTLTSLSGEGRLAKDDVRTEVERLKAQPGKDIGVGGATLAAECLRLGLVDEIGMALVPRVLGAGTRMFPTLDAPIPLRLDETRPFPGGVTYLRYAVVR